MKRNGTMKKMKFLTAGLIAAMMVPAAAQAQTRDIREERRDVREERRELRDAKRYGDRGDVREERREYRDAKRDYRSEERRGGKGCVSTGRSGWSPGTKKKN